MSKIAIFRDFGQNLRFRTAIKSKRTKISKIPAYRFCITLISTYMNKFDPIGLVETTPPPHPQQDFLTKPDHSQPSSTKPNQARPSLTKPDWLGFGYAWLGSLVRGGLVSLNGTDSETQTMKHGVLQGSISGPLLFFIYRNDFHRAISFIQSTL